MVKKSKVVDVLVGTRCLSLVVPEAIYYSRVSTKVQSKLSLFVRIEIKVFPLPLVHACKVLLHTTGTSPG
jgi:hypothetical protein